MTKIHVDVAVTQNILPRFLDGYFKTTKGSSFNEPHKWPSIRSGSGEEQNSLTCHLNSEEVKCKYREEVHNLGMGDI